MAYISETHVFAPSFFKVVGLKTLKNHISAGRERRALAELTPEQLADIGVSKAEAIAESRRPFWSLSRSR